MPSTPVPAPSGVLETCLYAADLDAAERFYRDVVGLDVLTRAEGRHVFFRCGGRMFLVFNPEATTRSGTDTPSHGARGAGHVAFEVPADAIEEWRHHLGRCGVAVEAEAAWSRGGTSLYVRDPAGNSVEFAPSVIWGVES